MKENIIERVINRILAPIASSYRFGRNIAKKTKRSMPYIYKEIEDLVRAHIISLDRNRELIHNPDIEGIADIVTKRIVGTLPNMY